MSTLPGILCSVYKGTRKEGLYLFVDKKEDIERVPQDIKDRMGKLSLAMTLHVTEGRKMARADASKVLNEIEKNGFYLQLPPALYPETSTNE